MREHGKSYELKKKGGGRGGTEPQRGMFDEMEWRIEVRCSKKGSSEECTQKAGGSAASSLSCVSLLCFPSLGDPGVGARRFLWLLSLCIIICPPGLLQLVLDVVLIQLFVVADHKFFGKVLQEVKKKPVQ